jgi:hypothetical protein
MLWAILYSACLWWTMTKGDAISDMCPLFGHTAEMNSGTNNYVVDFFANALLFAYAIDQCTATDFVPGIAYKYECNYNDSMWSVIKRSYANTKCTGSPASVDIIPDGGSAGLPGYFECSGDNTYAKLKLALTSDCSGAQVVYSGLGGCLLNQPLYNQLYCDDTNALVQFYLNTTFLGQAPTTDTPYGYCDSALYCAKWTFSKSCSAITNKLGPVVYGLMDECGSKLATSPSTTKGSKMISFSLLNILAVLLFLIH